MDTTEIIKQIFATQFQSQLKFSQIERNNGFYFPPLLVVDNEIVDTPTIDDPHYQQWIRQAFWRVVEELAETAEALIHGDDNLIEELADCLHFMVDVSLVIFPGQKIIEEISNYITIHFPSKLYKNIEAFHASMLGCVAHLGLTANQLKNRPWKQTIRQTDTEIFQLHFMSAWEQFVTLMSVVLKTPDDIYSMYCAKNRINSKRIADGA